MPAYSKMTEKELRTEFSLLKEEYEKILEMNLSLDMSRGKPSSKQLDLSTGVLTAITDAASAISSNGLDCRNYGVLDGIPEARELMAALLGVQNDEVVVGGTSSLNLMFDAVSRAMTHGLPESDKPWSFCEDIKFLCPVPGYDRHFAITQHFGIKMIPIEMDDNGPNMNKVEALVNNDPTIKGIWCVPKYSNPGGVTYSDETVRRLARLTPAAPDFRIFWDNAYSIHDLYEDRQDHLENIMDVCKKYGKEDMVYIFGSTSKISFPGAGLAAIGASKRNIEHICKSMSVQTIGHNKLTQLAHVRFYGNFANMKEFMKKHANILRPKFEMVLSILDNELKDLDIATWKKPNGGYFISLNVMKGCARRTVELCANAGVKLTPAGATYPYGIDPSDSNIRIAPSFPPEEELEQATKLLCLCVRMAALERLMARQ
ncbi:MAG: aminotransferase class I/II-fold pyridoxal phosphate-dependent enzyme [Oscillospiraceae bacterium]|nr:aminotransferase class I/II-fold pyridoxal phosphate-dependent enzyme [Oscillospiraceae bacterium]